MADEDLKRFHSMLLRLENGALNEDLTDALKRASQEIMDACTDRGGTHTATVGVLLKLSMNYKDKVMEIYPEVVEKLPKSPSRGRGAMFFVNADGEFTRENPRQLSLDDELAKRREEREDRINA